MFPSELAGLLGATQSGWPQVFQVPPPDFPNFIPPTGINFYVIVFDEECKVSCVYDGTWKLLCMPVDNGYELVGHWPQHRPAVFMRVSFWVSYFLLNRGLPRLHAGSTHPHTALNLNLVQTLPSGSEPILHWTPTAILVPVQNCKAPRGRQCTLDTESSKKQKSMPTSFASVSISPPPIVPPVVYPEWKPTQLASAIMLSSRLDTCALGLWSLSRNIPNIFYPPASIKVYPPTECVWSDKECIRLPSVHSVSRHSNPNTAASQEMGTWRQEVTASYSLPSLVMARGQSWGLHLASIACLPIDWTTLLLADWRSASIDLPALVVSGYEEHLLIGSANVARFNEQFSILEGHITDCMRQLHATDAFVEKQLSLLDKIEDSNARTAIYAAIRWMVIHPRLDWVANLRITLYNVVRLFWRLHKIMTEGAVVDCEFQESKAAMDVGCAIKCIGSCIDAGRILDPDAPNPFHLDVLNNDDYERSLNMLGRRHKSQWTDNPFLRILRSNGVRGTGVHMCFCEECSSWECSTLHMFAELDGSLCVAQ
mmetsp:Transcript_46690/g.73092  ORF Transcript_46690/g.73092 Transcript_46690/m.73092 type:complete len:539 (+) Transcript_46690:940-2556(+)